MKAFVFFSLAQSLVAGIAYVIGYAFGSRSGFRRGYETAREDEDRARLDTVKVRRLWN